MKVQVMRWNRYFYCSCGENGRIDMVDYNHQIRQTPAPVTFCRVLV